MSNMAFPPSKRSKIKDALDVLSDLVCNGDEEEEKCTESASTSSSSNPGSSGETN